MPVQLTRPSPTRPSFTPEFFQQPPTTLPWCEDISYPRHENDSLQAFENSDDFRSFEKQYKAVLDEFSEIAKSYGLDDSNVREVKERLFDPKDTTYLGRKAAIFGSGKRSFSKFIAQLQNDSIPLDTRRDKARNLIDNMGICADGVATHVSAIARDLELLLCGEEIYRYKNVAIEQLITEFVGDTPDLQIPGMELHYVNKISNALAEQFGLLFQEDSWRVDEEVTAQVIVDCREYILERLTPVTLAHHFAQTCVAELKKNMQSAFESAQSDDSEKSFDLDQFYETIKLTIDQQQGRYGQIEMASMVGAVEKGSDRYRLYTDPTLVAVDIINSLKQAGRIEDYSPRLLYRATPENTVITIESLDDLIWATEDGAAVLLTVEHLHSIMPDKSGNDYHRVAAKAIENSSEKSVLENLSPEWLEESVILQLLSIPEHEGIMAFVAKHQPFFERHYPFDLARIIVTHGGSAQLTSLLLPDDGRVFPGFLAALSKGNHRQVRAFGYILLQAANKGFLDAQQITTLLEARSSSFSALTLALISGRRRAIKAFGEIVMSLYDKKFLHDEQVALLLSCRTDNGYSALVSSLRHNKNDVISEFAKILLGIDTIKQRNADPDSDGEKTSPLLENVMTADELDERPFIDDRTEADLYRLLLTIRRFQTIRDEAVSDQPTPETLYHLEMAVQRIRIDLFSKDTYCTHDRHLANEATFVQLRQEWDILRTIPS